MSALDRQYPTLIAIGQEVWIMIGPHSPIWTLKEGKSLRFARHGTFNFVSTGNDGAVLRITVPRKGWNPKGPNDQYHTIGPHEEFCLCQGHVARVFSEDSEPVHLKYARRKTRW